MKATTHYLNANNHYKVYFAYEPYYGGPRYTSYDEMQSDEDLPNIEASNGILTCFLHSYYWSVTERVDMFHLDHKPTVGEVKDFMKRCFDYLEDKDDAPKQVRLSGEMLKKFRRDPHKLD